MSSEFLNNEFIEKAKNQGKKIIYKCKIQDLVKEIENEFEKDEVTEFYFCGQNAITSSLKGLTTYLVPISGVSYLEWKTDMIIVFTNYHIYIINNNSILEKINQEKFKKERVKKINLYTTKDSKVLELLIDPKYKYAVYINKVVEEEYINEIQENFNVNIIKNKYSNKFSRVVNILTILQIIVIILVILYFIKNSLT